MGIESDVTGTESFRRFLAAVDAEWGRLDVLANNAGVMWVGPFDAEPESAARRQVEVDLLGVIRGVKLAAPAMVARGSGDIVTIASAASVLPTPGEATYAATKHGVLGYLRSVRAELHRSGVDVSVIMPAVVDTTLAAGTATGAARRLAPGDVARTVLRTIKRPRFELTVPRYVDPLNRAISLCRAHSGTPPCVGSCPIRSATPTCQRAAARRSGCSGSSEKLRPPALDQFPGPGAGRTWLGLTYRIEPRPAAVRALKRDEHHDRDRSAA